MPIVQPDPFEAELLSHQPYLVGQARRMTRDSVAAEDLVQDTIVRAIQYRDSFQLGTNMRGWLTFIMRSLFLTGIRRKKWDGGSIEELVVLPSRPASQHAAIDLADAVKALQLLHRDQREALLLVGAGASYEEAAEDLCCSVGTIKSRVARGRDALREALA